MAIDFRTMRPTEFYQLLVNEKVRPDGRDLPEARAVSVNTGSITTAEGSSLVKLGNTTVVCGIKGELTTPNSEEPRKGFIVPNVDLPALCSADFRPGPPSDLAQVTSTLLDSIIKQSQCFDLEDLCLESGKTVWVLYCDLVCLNFDGSLLDACCLALFAALKTTRLPAITIQTDFDVSTPSVDVKRRTMLSLHTLPVATSFAFYNNDVILIDPSVTEEEMSHGSVTIVTRQDGTLVSVHKPGGCAIKEQQLNECIARARTRNSELAQIVAAAAARSPDQVDR